MPIATVTSSLSDSFHRAFRNITGLKNTGKLLTIPNPVTVENQGFL